MSLGLARNDSYALLDDTWLRHQSARICQRHLQFGRHCRLDLDTLLVAAARLLPRSQQARAERAHWIKRPSTLATSAQASKGSEQWRLAAARGSLDAAEA
jgi:hypothetical protein